MNLTEAKITGLEFIDENGEFITEEERMTDARFVLARNSKALTLLPLFKIKVKSLHDGYPKLLTIRS